MKFLRLIHLVVILSLMVPIAGCSPPAPQAIERTPCLAGRTLAECGKLSVFENRATNQGRKIEIHVAVIKAKKAPAAPDPIFYLAGGPGGSAIDDAEYAQLVLKTALEHRDLVLVDQRGTGRSNRLTCPMPVAHSIGLTPISRQAIDLLHSCISGLDADASAYTTAWGMDDLDDVRAALGYEQINLYGESYGTIAEQVYLQRHAKHVRSMVLEGVSLADVPIFELAPRNTQRAWDQLLARCRADEACRTAYPNLEGEFKSLLEQVEKQPVPLNMTGPDSGETIQLTRGMLVSGVFSLLRDTEKTVLLPWFIHQGYQKKWDAISQAFSSSFDPNAPAPTWRIMNLTILCHESWARMRRAETEQAAAQSFMRYEEARSLVVPEEVCAVVPRPSAAALYRPVTTSNKPVLLISNGADPWNPPENVAGAKDHYPNSLMIVAPGQGHGYTGFACRGQILAGFFEAGSFDGLDTGCLQNELLPAFKTGE